MSGLRRSIISLLLMLFHLKGVTGQYSAFAVRDGDEITLPCENVFHNQNECENTSWLFRGAGNTHSSVELVTLGWVGENGKAESDRLSVTENCSLVIKKVTVEDVGRYSCRQFINSGKQQGEDAHVYLAVVTMDEFEDTDKVTLHCSVSTYGWCTQRVNWMVKGKDTFIRNVKTSQDYCSASVTFMTSCYNYTLRNGLLTCQATDIYTGKVQQFTFSPQSSGEDATTVRPIEKSTKGASANNDTSNQQGWWRFLIVSVGLAALIITVVGVNVWTRTKGNRTQMNENIVRNDEDDGAVTYENLGDRHASDSRRH